MELTNIQTEKNSKKSDYLFLFLLSLISCGGVVWYFYSGQPEGVKNILYVYFPMGAVAVWGGITGDMRIQWSAAVPAILFFIYNLHKII